MLTLARAFLEEPSRRGGQRRTELVRARVQGLDGHSSSGDGRFCLLREARTYEVKRVLRDHGLRLSRAGHRGDCCLTVGRCRLLVTPPYRRRVARQRRLKPVALEELGD